MTRSLIVFWLSLWIPTAAFASLHGTKDSLNDDATTLSGTVGSEAKFPLYSVVEITAEELSVKEFVSNAGVVFGIVWKGSHPPDMKQLLGTHYDEFLSGVKTAKKKQGRSPISISTSKMRVESGGHMRALYGKALVPSLVPAGVQLDEIHY